MDFSMMIDSVSANVPKRADGDYIGEDGLLYCGSCRTRKECRHTMPQILGGGERTLPIMCKCAQMRYDEEIARSKHEADMDALRELRRLSLMDAMYEDTTFDTSIENDENRRALSISRTYCDKFSEMCEKNRGLLFYGPPGTGKTHMAACIANRLMSEGKSVLMTSFVKLNASGFDQTDEDIIGRMKRARLLIVDDLGAERGSEYSLERVYNIIDSRVRARLPMVLTTNLSMAQMQDRTDTRYWRIYDRVIGCCYPVEFKGKSFRRASARTMFEEMNDVFGV